MSATLIVNNFFNFWASVCVHWTLTVINQKIFVFEEKTFYCLKHDGDLEERKTAYETMFFFLCLDSEWWNDEWW